eukprot:13752031-Alexandrium_andersonii.AAC.1
MKKEALASFDPTRVVKSPKLADAAHDGAASSAASAPVTPEGALAGAIALSQQERRAALNRFDRACQPATKRQGRAQKIPDELKEALLKDPTRRMSLFETWVQNQDRTV